MSRPALYPGCSLEGTETAYLASLTRALSALGIELPEMREWNCCGATSAHAMDHKLYLGLAMRNLALAEAQGFDEVLAPCAACYHRLASANFELTRDADLLAGVSQDTELDYSGSVTVRNILDFLTNVTGLEQIAARVVKPLSRLKVACYYGCLNTRIPRMPSFDDMAYPMTMDRIVRGLGAETIDWSYKTECCGASLFVTAESAACRLVGRILEDAALRGADCVAVACPMCHNNLDTKQADIRLQHDIPRPLPVLFVSQLMGLAFGLEAPDLRIEDGFVSASSLELSSV